MMVRIVKRERLADAGDQRFMRAAIAEAKAAARDGNAPIGAVIVRNGRIVERGRNKVFTSQDITAHAEIVVIRKTTRRLRNLSLKSCTLYTTFVPCAMCIVTMLRTNIRRVVYGAEASDALQFSSGIHQELNRGAYGIARARVNFLGGVLREECAKLLENAKPD